MPKPSDMLTINVDGVAVHAERGQKILDAARHHGIFIPTLCAHEDLTPFGGCRMCIVEVEGMRGFPTACTTPVEEGMVIRTQTAGLQAERSEILQLILSEHPVGCLLCDERSECGEYMGTLRKAGVTSGCGNCPKDNQCELQEVAAWVGLKEMRYPVRYRNLRVEKEDPFFDRDYNLCILCGRCVRACQELRIAGTLAFKQRGPAMTIGPAFGRTHIEAGCEFCGTCVTVCPTGALAEKAGKWEGKADRETVTTCPLCGFGCQLRLRVKRGKVVGVLPVEGERGISGQLCVKGRFGVTEFVNGYERLTKPYKLHESTRLPLTWEEATALAAEALSTCPPEKFAMLISADGTNEDAYVAQKFARSVMGGNRIDTTARAFYGSGFGPYLSLLRQSVSLHDLAAAAMIFCIGADTRLGGSVVGVAVKQALQRGARLVTLNARDHNFVRVADHWLKPEDGNELPLLESLIQGTETHDAKTDGKIQRTTDELARALTLLKSGKPIVIIVGTDLFVHPHGARLLDSVIQLAANLGAGILPMVPQGNLPGSVLMGAYPEFLPGAVPSADGNEWNATRMLSEAGLQVVYVIGDVLPRRERIANFVIAQNLYPPESLFEVDLILPSAAFTEVDGTLVTSDGRVAHLSKAVDPPAQALPDWQILCRIAQAMGAKGFDFADVAEVQREIAQNVAGFYQSEKHRAMPLWNGEIKLPSEIVSSVREVQSHRGFPLAGKVEGLKALFSEDQREVLMTQPQSEHA